MGKLTSDMDVLGERALITAVLEQAIKDGLHATGSRAAISARRWLLGSEVAEGYFWLLGMDPAIARSRLRRTFGEEAAA